MHKKIFPIVLIAILISTAILYISMHIFSLNGNKIKKISIGNRIFFAEVVSGDKKLQEGLGGRDSLCQSCAMLFEFPKAREYSFWMKDMKFPLDIIWLKEGKIVHIEKNVSEKFSGVLSPQADADRVLEINAGMSDKIELKIGDNAEF